LEPLDLQEIISLEHGGRIL